MSNPTFQRSVSTATFAVSFKAWIESDTMRIPGHTTHQARHTLATRLVAAGASMTHIKRVLGQDSERMGESYVLIAGTQVEPYLQQIWGTGPGATQPGRLVLTPTDVEKAPPNGNWSIWPRSPPSTGCARSSRSSAASTARSRATVPTANTS
jgi:hypothetical protein